MQVKRSESTTELMGALIKFQTEIKNPEKNTNVNVRTRKGDKYNYKYTTLADTIDWVKEKLGEHGLGITQYPINNGPEIGVSTILMHESGEFIEYPPLFVPDDKGTAQGVGSAITYARRYTLSAILGIASDEDDDANAGTYKSSNGTGGSSAADERLAMFKENPSSIFSHKIDFSKHKGKTFEEITKENPGFIDYVYKETQDPDMKYAAEMIMKSELYKNAKNPPKPAAPKKTNKPKNTDIPRENKNKDVKPNAQEMVKLYELAETKNMTMPVTKNLFFATYSKTIDLMTMDEYKSFYKSIEAKE